MAQQAVTFSEIEKMLEHFPDQPHTGCDGCDRKKSPFEATLDHVKAWQVNEEHVVKLDRTRVCLFAASHGAEPNSIDQIKAWLVQSSQGTAPINQLCKLADAELRVYELDIENPSADITCGSAMNEEEAARAITYGMMAIEPGLDCVVLGSIGVGSSLSAQAIISALSDEIPENEQVKKALSINDIQSIQKPLEVLRCLGGYDFCAMLGTAIAARMAGIPILIDGAEGRAIKDILDAMAPSAGDHLYMIEESFFTGQPYRAVAILPSMKAHLILGASSCHSQGACGQRKAS